MISSLKKINTSLFFIWLLSGASLQAAQDCVPLGDYFFKANSDYGYQLTCDSNKSGLSCIVVSFGAHVGLSDEDFSRAIKDATSPEGLKKAANELCGAKPAKGEIMKNIKGKVLSKHETTYLNDLTSIYGEFCKCILESCKKAAITKTFELAKSTCSVSNTAFKIDLIRQAPGVYVKNYSPEGACLVSRSYSLACGTSIIDKVFKITKMTSGAGALCSTVKTDDGIDEFKLGGNGAMISGCKYVQIGR